MTARRAWAEGRWTHPPVSSAADGDDLVVEAVAQSDAWRITSYGFVHDTEHALVAELGASEAVEVVFGCDFTAQFDQAGVFVRVDDETWVKAGVEFAALEIGLMSAAAIPDAVLPVVAPPRKF